MSEGAATHVHRRFARFHADNASGFLLRHAVRLYNAAMQRRLGALECATGQYPLLLFLWEKDGQTETELGRKARIVGKSEVTIEKPRPHSRDASATASSAWPSTTAPTIVGWVARDAICSGASPVRPPTRIPSSSGRSDESATDLWNVSVQRTPGASAARSGASTTAAEHPAAAAAATRSRAWETPQPDTVAITRALSPNLRACALPEADLLFG